MHDSVNLSRHMRAAAILGLGCSANDLRLFQTDKTIAGVNIDWRMGVPASGDEADVVVLFGGDGTIHRHLGQLVKLGLPVLVVPSGSGNDFARSLGLRRVRDSLSAWQKFCLGTADVSTIDLGLIAPREAIQTEARRDAGSTARYFCCVAGLGLDGEVAWRANRLPRWLRAHGGYALTLIPTIFRFAALPVKILTPADGLAAHESPPANWTTRSDQPTILAAFANTPTYGGGMKIAPKAKMNDGLLDVCIVRGIDAFKLFCLFPTVYFGRHLNLREVEYFQSGAVRVETEHPLDVYADGEYVCRTPVEVSVQPAALRVIVHPSQTSF